MTHLNSINESIEVNLLLEEKNYWSSKINEDFRKTIIPYNAIDSEIVQRDKLFSFSLTENASSEIIKLGNGSESRIFVILSSCLVVMLSGLDMDNSQIVIGMPVYNDIDNLNPNNSVIPLIVNIEKAKSFKDILNIVKNDVKEGLENYAYPIKLLTNLLHVENNQDQGFPIFDITVSLENIQDKNVLNEFKTNIHFNFIKNYNSIEVEINYNSIVYDFKVIQQISEIFSFLTSELLKDIAKDISLLDIIPGNQKYEIIDEFNNTYKEYENNITIIDRFVSIAKKYPDKVALVFEDKSITYGLLDYCSSLLCSKLREKGATNNELVGLMCDRSIDHIIGILGIFKSGAGYLAIDPKTPYDRIDYMVKDSGTNMIIGQSKYLDNIKIGVELLDISNINEWAGSVDGQIYCNQESIAYILYTSGTTGFPKGVLTEQGNISAYCNSFLQEFKFQPSDIILQQASYAFDTFTEEVFPILLVGGKIIVAEYELVRNVPELAKYIIKNSISIIDCSPLLINELGKLFPISNSLSTIISGGDVLKGVYIDNYSDKIEIYNTYGPTESTVCATFYKCGRNIKENIPIGNPISNYKVLILNNNLKLVPTGFKGEICIAGDGLSRGYLNNVELTAEKFIIEPQSKTRIYRSGDLGEFGYDGIIKFSGRKDNQLSLRGYRIELGEIENQVISYYNVSNAKVIAIERNNEKWICAYVVSTSYSIENELKEYLYSRIPEYMIPSFIIKVDHIPVNSNGKVSVKLLPDPFKTSKGLVRFIDNNTIHEVKGKLNTILKKSRKEDKFKIESFEVSDIERDRLLYEFNNTNQEYNKKDHIIDLFEEQVERNPNHIAIVFNNEFYSYSQLDKCINILTQRILNEGVEGNAIIGLLTQRSFNMIVGILSILKSGCAFMPLEEEATGERQNNIISNTKPELIIIDEKYSSKKLNVKTLNISKCNFSEDIERKDITIRNFDDVTHLLHTSGTTGIPKGVLLNNYSIINLFNYVGDLLNLNEKENVLSITPSTFDVFNAETLLPLTKGCKVIIVDTKGVLDVKGVLNLIMKEYISFFQCSPTVLQKLLKEENSVFSFKNVSNIISAGEPLLESLKNKFNEIQNTQLYNLYGPSETSIYSTGKNVTGINSLNIGKPVYNTKIRILDNYEQLVPIEKLGEIYIGGDGVARGYINQPEFTDEVFKNIDNKTYYKTGDLACWLNDGDIEFYGRIDHQVQIAGARVELGEIENSLLSVNEINEAAVITKEDKEGVYLLAFIVAQKRMVEQDIKVKLSQSLPLLMIPRYIIQLENMPYTSSRKIHRKLLELIEIPDKIEEALELPESEMEIKLLEIWSDLLEVPKEKISVDSNFFIIGGHSLNAAILAGRIHKEIDIEFTLQDVFLYISIREQAKQIEKRGKKKYIPIPKAIKQEFYNLSSAQRRLFILQQIDPISTAYNMPYAIALNDTIDKKKIEIIFRKLLNRHQSFRTSFMLQQEFPVQYIHENVELELKEFYIEQSEEKDFREGFIKPFDLSQAPLLRVAILSIKGGGNYLMIDMHHIISDGVSHIILEKEFQQLYLEEKLLPLDLQYIDYCEWQNGFDFQQRKKAQEFFWLEQFKDEVPVLNLPTDFIRPSVQSNEGANVSFFLNFEETKTIKMLAKKNDLTLYMSVLSLYCLFISKISGQEDIIIGIPVAGRNHPDLDQVVGMFINTLALRIKIFKDETLQEFISKLKHNVLNAFENQDYQFEELVEKISINRDVSRNPLFDVVCNFLNQTEQIDNVSESGSKEVIVHYKGISKFDLTLTAIDYGEQLVLNLEYCTKLFKEDTINRFIDYFKQIIKQLSNTNAKISSIEIISEQEKQQILYSFNTKTDYQKNKTIIELFEEQVERSPDKIAIIYGHQQITYEELNRKSNQLANFLIEQGILNERIIGVLYETSMYIYIGILGILKTGRAYLPIDNTLPEPRINLMLNDSNIKLLLGGKTSLKISDNKKFFSIRDIKFNDYSNTNLSLNILSSEPAYVIYTSGSTGVPKGVIIGNKSLVNLSVWHNEIYKINSTDRLSKFAGFGFDASVWETFPGLIAGASLYIIEDHIKLDPIEVNKYFDKHNITVSFLPTQFCEKFISNENNSLRILLTGGDKLKYFKRNNYTLYNNYGPTESTVVATNFIVDGFYDNIPIGKPLPNCQILILDNSNNIQPIGIPGELCISGDTLALGYLNNIELTLDKFTPHPINIKDRIYRTGDLARWLPDGNIEFLGRIDNQVKIRGYRIELMEVENTLLKHEDIKECVVVVKERNKEKFMCAYIVSTENFDLESIRNYLTNHLPHYMVPANFVGLNEMPINANGKIDLKLLPDPEIKVKDYIAPKNEIEHLLVDIWSEVLGIDKKKISMDSNFFELGGNSLLIIKVVHKINNDTERKLKVIDLFKHTTIRELTNYINEGGDLKILDNSRLEGINKGKNTMKQMLRKNKA